MRIITKKKVIDYMPIFNIPSHNTEVYGGKIDIFTTVWGIMIDWYLEMTLPSLLQPLNIPKSRDFITYTFHADDEAKDRITANELYRRLEKLVQTIWIPLKGERWTAKKQPIANKYTLQQMKISAARGNYMLIAPPDTVFGNDSIFNLVELTHKKYNPILYVFPKLNGRQAIELKTHIQTKGTLSNRDLVSICVKRPTSSVYNITQRDSNTWIMVNRVPTACILPDKQIIDFFSQNHQVNGGFDHVMPYWMVTKGYPWHLIQDSDIFFQSERTAPGSILARGWEPRIAEQGEQFFSQFEVILRGANA